MNFEQFHLPGFLLRDLYKESLVELNEIQKPADKKPELKDHALGNNQKQVLILADYAESQVIPDQELGFLLTILNACKLTLNDVVIVNFAAKEKITYEKLLQEFNPKVVLLFGVKPASINMPIVFPDFQVQSFIDIRFLSSPPLQSLQQDDAIKRKLWTGLKQLFLS